MTPACVLALALGGPLCAAAFVPYSACGIASFYAHDVNVKWGDRIASGVYYDAEAMTAAHWTLPLGSRVRVTDPTTGRAVVVRVNDRGPHPRLKRLIDLTPAAAYVLNGKFEQRGLIRVCVEAVR